MSIAGTATCAPAATAAAIVASASSAAMYVAHTGGWFSSCNAPIPATSLPSSRNIPYGISGCAPPNSQPNRPQ